jgi:hypothetical protein
MDAWAELGEKPKLLGAGDRAASRGYSFLLTPEKLLVTYPICNHVVNRVSRCYLW